MRARHWILIASGLFWGALLISAFLPEPGIGSLGLVGSPQDEFGRPSAKPAQTLSGTLLGADGEPRAGYLLLGESGSRLVSARSDAAGRFVIEGLEAGLLDLALVGPELPLTARQVQVPNEGELVLQLDAPLPPVPVLGPIERAPFSGHLTLAFSDLPEGYEIWLAPLPELENNGFKLSGLSGAQERRVRVDAEGRFDFPDLVLARYGLSVLPPWAAGGDWPLLLELAFEHSEASEDRELTTQGGQIMTQLRDQDGRPVQGARLEVRDAARPERVWPPFFSGPDGRLRARDLPAGSYRASLTVGGANRTELVRISTLRTTELDWSPLVLGG